MFDYKRLETRVIKNQRDWKAILKLLGENLHKVILLQRLLIEPYDAKYPEISFDRICNFFLDAQERDDFGGYFKLQRANLELCYQAATVTDGV